jgi:glycosyltransferase involved in cell wall biosynthesis
LYIALTEFARQKFIEGGLPANKIVVKPNFLHDDPGIGNGQGGYVLFVGRLSQEKGLETLIKAWKLLSPRIPLKIVGDGPMAPYVAREVEALEGVEWVGLQSHDRVLTMMKEAAAVIIPSVWYEGCPLTIIEAYAVGTPVVGSRLGSMSSMIKPGRTGLFFNPGDPKDLARQVESVLVSPEILENMRRSARMEFETQYSAERNYEMLMALYERVIERDRRDRVEDVPSVENVSDAPVGV